MDKNKETGGDDETAVVAPRKRGKQEAMGALPSVRVLVCVVRYVYVRVGSRTAQGVPVG